MRYDEQVYCGIVDVGVGVISGVAVGVGVTDVGVGVGVAGIVGVGVGVTQLSKHSEP